MTGPCAKRRVRCEIWPKGGAFITGENSCENPQPACPRLPGEGYEKCKSICRQGDHAEHDALRRAKELGVDLHGATAVIVGHYWMCEPCGKALREAGVKKVIIQE